MSRRKLTTTQIITMMSEPSQLSIARKFHVKEGAASPIMLDLTTGKIVPRAERKLMPKPTFNPFEFNNREIKKHKLITFIYARFFKPTNAKERRMMANIIKNATTVDKQWMAREANVLYPSDETWAQIVKEIQNG